MNTTSGTHSGAGPDPEHGGGSDPYRSHERRTAWFAAGGVVVLLLGLYGAGVAVAGDQLPSGTQVGDVSLGGLAPADAQRLLRQELRPRATEPITLSVGGQDTTLDPAKAGLSLDIAATVDRAGGGSALDPRTLWDSFFGGDRVAPVVRVDQEQLIAALEDLADRTGSAAVEPRVTFDGAQPVVREPRRGGRIDVGLSAVAIREAWLVDDRTVELPVTSTTPEVGTPALRAAARETVRPLVSAPITLRLPDRDVRLTPNRYAPAFTLGVVDGRLVTTVDEARLVRRIGRLVRSVQEPARPASVELVGGRPRVVPAQLGRQVGPRAFSRAVLTAARSGGERTARVTGTTTRPGFTTADARGLGIDRVVSSFTTSYPHEDYRNTNIGRAAQLINGTVLRPGETFSLNDTVGERTAANGFVKGFIISGGVFAEDFGGGVSQVATTTFNAAFFAGLEDVEHQPHSFYIDRYPEGREATVAWGSIDLQFRNDTDHGVLIETFIEPSAPGGTGEMHARIWSTKTWDIRSRTSDRYDLTAPGTQVIRGAGCVPTTGYGGFDVDVHRDFYRPGSSQRVRTETFRTTYIPLDTVVCR